MPSVLIVSWEHSVGKLEEESRSLFVVRSLQCSDMMHVLDEYDMSYRMPQGGTTYNTMTVLHFLH